MIHNTVIRKIKDWGAYAELWKGRWGAVGRYFTSDSNVSLSRSGTDALYETKWRTGCDVTRTLEEVLLGFVNDNVLLRLCAPDPRSNNTYPDLAKTLTVDLEHKICCHQI
jgi:hypothetical protein